MFIKNITKIPQIFYDKYGNPHKIEVGESKDVDTRVNVLPYSFCDAEGFKKLDMNANYKNKKPRLMFVMTSNYIGGAEILFLNLIEQLKAEYDCYLVFVYERTDCGFLSNYPCPTFTMENIYPHNIGVGIGYLSQLLNIDLMFITNIVTHVRTGIKKNVQCKIVDVSHAEEGLNYVYPDSEPFVKEEIFDYIITVNERTKNYALKKFQKNRIDGIECIENGINTELFTVKEKEFSNIIGNAARISGEKNPERFNTIAKLIPDKHFKWIGGVNPECNAFASTIKWQPNTEMTGYINNKEIVNQLHSLDIFMLTSNNEGMPLAVLEAMACGLPVISTKVGNMYKLIDKECLYDTPEQAAYLIKRLYNDKEFYNKCAKANRLKIEQEYSLKEMANKYINIIERLRRK